MLDNLEEGPWPSFISGIKSLRDRHEDSRINAMSNDLLGQLEHSYETRKGYWKITNPKRTKSQKTFKKTVKFICKKTKKPTDEQGLVAEIYNSIPVWLAPPISEVKKEIRALKKEKSETLENFF